MYLTEGISNIEIKKIFQNRGNKEAYLKRLFQEIGSEEEIAKSNPKIDEQIINTWNYEVSKKVIRDLFSETEKYKYIKGCKKAVDKAIKDWKSLHLGEFDWPFGAMNFDQHVHQLNRRDDISEEEKDQILAQETIKFRRIKDINALRNDYIEYLIFQNENVIPTFGNNRGVDFYIDGRPFDQKVSKSVGRAFMDYYGDSYREKAISEPYLVAQSMYQNQDEERFGSEPRLLIIYLDSDVSSSQIEEQLSNIDFSHPMEIDFDYKHAGGEVITYQTKCFVVLLHH